MRRFPLGIATSTHLRSGLMPIPRIAVRRKMVSFMSEVIDFSLRFTLDDAPAAVLAMGRRLALDLIGVAAAGRQTTLASIAANPAHRYLAAGAGGSARILFDGRKASPLGAA